MDQLNKFVRNKFKGELRTYPTVVQRTNKQMGSWNGGANYKANQIAVNKSLSLQKKKETIAHEIGHFKLRQMGVKRFSPSLIKEAKKSNFYKSYMKEHYKKTPQKIPNEMFAEVYAVMKSGYSNQKQFKNLIGKKYPITYRTFNKLINKKLKG